MGDLDIRIRHGGGSAGHLALTGAVIGIIGAAGGVSGVFSGAATFLLWLGGTLAVAIAGLSALAIRAMRRGWRPGYIRSVHGDSPRNRLIEENDRLREEIRAMRTREELEEIMGMPITAWQARILDQMVHGSPTGRLVVGRTGLYQQVPGIPGHE